MSRIILFFSAVLICISGYAQSIESPPSKSILLLGATAHIGNGEIIENSAIGIRDGKIDLIVDATVARFDRTKFDEIIDLTDQHIYPGFIASVTNMGLREIGAVRATRDDYEVGEFNPHIRSAIAFNTDSRVLPTIRSNGVLLVQTIPLGGLISGTSSVMHLNGWNWEDALVKEDDAIHMFWPRLMQRGGWWGNPEPVEKNKNYDEIVRDINSFFEESAAYNKIETHTTANLRHEAMRGVFDGSKKVFIRCRSAKEITDVIRFGEKFGLDYVLVDAAFAPDVAGLLKEYDVPVILDRTHRLPPHSHSDYDYSYKLPALLAQEGIRYGITLGSNSNAFWDFRNLPFQASQSIPYGLNPETALASITGSLADILGLDDYGTLEKGKDATMVVSKGDALDMMTCDITNAWIHGQSVELDNKQKALYRKYISKYGIE